MGSLRTLLFLVRPHLQYRWLVRGLKQKTTQSNWEDYRKCVYRGKIKLIGIV